MAPSLPAVQRALSIAGVEVGVGSSSLDIAPAQDPVYAPFVTAPSRAAASPCDVEVAVCAGSPPAASKDLLFDTGAPWAMYRNPEGYRVAFRRVGSDAEYLSVVSDAATTRVSVYLPEAASGVQVPNPFCYPLDQVLLMNHLATRGGLIIHAAGVIVGGRALLLCGTSGAGKTTLARLFLAAGLVADLLSDDRVIVRTDPVAGFRAWGTPWPGDAGVARNQSAPLGALLFLTQAEENALLPLAPAAALARLAPVLTCPWYDRERLPGVFDTLQALMTQVPCYDLHFRPDESVVALLTAIGEGPGSS